jgi:hypothetical protein
LVEPTEREERMDKQPPDNGTSSQDAMAGFSPVIVAIRKKTAQAMARFAKTVENHSAAIHLVVEACGHPTYYECKYLSSAENNHNGYSPPLRLCATCGLLVEQRGCGPMTEGENIGFMDRSEMFRASTERIIHEFTPRDDCY